MKTTTVQLVKVMLTIAISLLATGNAHAVLSSHLISGPVSLVNAPETYQQANLRVYLNPGQTNWIAWSRLDHLDSMNGRNYIDGDSSRPNFGIDDYFTLTITDPNGRTSQRFTMDMNDKWGNSTGQQAIIFGSQSGAPDVVRYNISNRQTIFNEAGIANSFLTGLRAGWYNLHFDFRNLWNLTAGHQNIYLLVDTCVPEPATLILSALGLAGMALVYRRRSHRLTA